MALKKALFKPAAFYKGIVLYAYIVYVCCISILFYIVCIMCVFLYAYVAVYNILAL